MPAPTGSPGTAVDLHLHLRAWRYAHGYTCDRLVEKMANKGLFVSDNTIAQWERGVRKITLDVLDALARVYGVKPGALFEPPPHQPGHAPAPPPRQTRHAPALAAGLREHMRKVTLPAKPTRVPKPEFKGKAKTVAKRRTR